jgi:hypothetical protein
LALSAMVCLIQPARAALGGKADTIEKDKKTLNLANAVARSTKSFRFEEMVSSDAKKKFKVRQFISENGNIFAVAWSGNIDTQLDSLLGEYAADFAKQEADHPPRKGRIPFRRVVAGRVVLEFWNELRRVQGKAYVPALLPEGVTPDQFNMAN